MSRPGRAGLLRNAAIVLGNQRDSTTVVPPGARAVTDKAGNIIITLGASR